MSPETVAFLATAPAQTQIADTRESLRDRASELALLSELRKGHDPERAAAILEQARLQLRAAAKFGTAAQGLLLLPESLEQASRVEVSAERARRLVTAGVTAIYDAGAGIGADSIAYAEAGLHVTAIEHDPLVAAVLRNNARGRNITVVEGNALDHVPANSVVFFDPARRSDGRRIFDPQQCSPPLSSLVEVAQRSTVVAKMSPSLNLSDVPAGWDVDYVSTQTEQGRAVVEAVLWSPPLGRGVRRAKVITERVSVLESDSNEQPATVGDIGAFVYEPDGAVSQAGLVNDLAADLGASLIEPQIAYLTGNRATRTPFAKAYEVLDVLPWAKRAVARALTAYDARDLVVKKRGVAIDPTALRRELLPKLRSRTGEQLVLILTPQGRSTTAIIARALNTPADRATPLR